MAALTRTCTHPDCPHTAFYLSPDHASRTWRPTCLDHSASPPIRRGNHATKDMARVLCAPGHRRVLSYTYDPETLTRPPT